jgi:trk system potassium uptake protein TrkH
VPQRFIAAFFQSVTTRTAGFNSIDNAVMGSVSKLLTVLLMFIGACPGSTGGGIK